jgi:signal transduction histidine kinase/CheY-like chemotaxis protein
MSIKVDETPVWQTSEMPDDFIENQYISVFLKQGASSHAGLVLCVFAMYVILVSKIDGYYPHIFLLITLVVNAIRIFFTHKILGIYVDKVATISKLHFLHGMTHALPLLGFSYLGEIDKSIITIILLTISTASVSTTNGYKYKYLWFVVPLLIPLSLAWAFVDNGNTNAQHWGNYTLAFLIVAYLFYLIGLGKDLFSVFNESCHIRFSESEKNQKLILALDEAKNASLAKTRFLASASHDLRQPMHTIGVLLAALRLRTLDERSREIVEVLGTVNDSLSSQLDGLLDISKLDAGVVTPDLQVYKLGDLVRAHVAKITLSDEKEKLYVHVHAATDVLVKTDIVLFERVLMNLTGNAIKFTEQGGIDITISATDEKVILEVADTGIGIASNFQNLVFQEFYQVGNAERDRTAGLGLGLSIVKRICSLLNIHIHLISAIGQGSRFVMTMPLVRNTDYISMKKTTQETIHLPVMTALVVDDEIDIRTGMRLLLEELGCKVVLADGIDQAVAAAKVHQFDVIFSDYRLRGDENGIDAIGHVRVVQPGVDAVLITGDTAPERLRSAQNANIEMLHKPVSFEAILKQLRKTAGSR